MVHTTLSLFSCTQQLQLCTHSSGDVEVDILALAELLVRSFERTTNDRLWPNNRLSQVLDSNLAGSQVGSSTGVAFKYGGQAAGMEMKGSSNCLKAMALQDADRSYYWECHQIRRISAEVLIYQFQSLFGILFWSLSAFGPFQTWPKLTNRWCWPSWKINAESQFDCKKFNSASPHSVTVRFPFFL